MAPAMAVGASGSTSSAAPAAVSGSDVESEQIDRAAGGHRLDDREAEALVQAREDQAAGARQQHGQVVVGDVAEPAHGVGDAEPVGQLRVGAGSCFGRPAIASTASPPSPRACTVAHASSSRARFFRGCTAPRQTA